jgi:hypothetical protein
VLTMSPDDLSPMFPVAHCTFVEVPRIALIMPSSFRGKTQQAGGIAP